MYGFDTYADTPYGDVGGPSTAKGVVDGLVREVMGAGTGSITTDQIFREALGAGTSTLTTDTIIRQILLVNETGVFVDQVVRMVLAEGLPTINVAITETLNPRDGAMVAPIYFNTLTESLSLTDRLRIVTRNRKRAHPPLAQNHPDPAVRDLQTRANELQQGRMNTGFIEVTCLADSATTTVVDPRLGPDTHISLMALSDEAAQENVWIERQRGRLILHHTNDPDTNRRFALNIIS